MIQSQAEAVGGLEEYPYLVEVSAELARAGYDHAAEFEWGLDLILESLEPSSPAGS